ncbi:MAG: hypothetical protein Q9O62_08470 [Ardenticatenia bacterium]|nr:hypothetical protein [Ardenticatenia bacterium]
MSAHVNLWKHLLVAVALLGLSLVSVPTATGGAIRITRGSGSLARAGTGRSGVPLEVDAGHVRGAVTGQPAENSSSPGDIVSRPVLGEQKILFILVYYPGEREPILTEEAARQVAGIVQEGLERNSYGHATFTIDVTPPLPMPQPVSYYQNGPTLVRVRADALQAARRAGYAVEIYDREVIISPKIWPYATGQGTLNGHTALVGCDWCPYLVLHELGHTFGWMHANFWQVTAGSPIAPNGTEVEYGDPFDIMGDQLPGRPRAFHHYNPWFKWRAGWIPPENVREITEPGTYTVTIRALERAPQRGTGITEYTAVRLPRNPRQDYWLFYRAEEPEGNDGLILTWGARSNVPASILLDMTPGSQGEDWRDVELGVGERFHDSEAGVEVRVLEKTPDTLRVEVVVEPRTLDRLPVIDVLSPGGDRVVSGTVRYEATAYDPDVGSVNGAGIATVTLYLHPLDDPLIAALRAGQVPPHPVVTATLSAPSAPPYVLEVPTDGAAPAVPDGVYALVVTAVGEDGGRNTIWYPHIIDNTGPSASPPTHTLWLPLVQKGGAGMAVTGTVAPLDPSPTPPPWSASCTASRTTCPRWRWSARSPRGCCGARGSGSGRRRWAPATTFS